MVRKVFFVLVLATALALGQTSPRAQEATPRPNVVLIVADDLEAGAFRFMPKTKSLLGNEGTTFSNAFVTTTTCCPSRSSLLTGRYTHNHKVFTNLAPAGSVTKFRQMGHESNGLPAREKAAGYETALIGKYLNGYGADGSASVPQGWDEWHAGFENDGPAPYYDYRLSHNGTVSRYGSAPEDYQTDVYAKLSEGYVRSQAQSPAPFFAYLAPRSPHDATQPAPRHKGAYPRVKIPRTPSFDEADVSDKPAAIRRLPRLSSSEIAALDAKYRGRAEMLLALDEMVAGVVRTLEETGELDNTYVVFTSDNGWHMGQHRLRPNKTTAYEEDIKVPLLVRGPGVVKGTVRNELVANIDLAPTIAELSGAELPDADGRSLVPLLGGDTPRWRRGLLVEFFGVNGAPLYRALRTPTIKYVRHENGEREFYKLGRDPYETANRYGILDAPAKATLNKRLNALVSCAGDSCRAQ